MSEVHQDGVHAVDVTSGPQSDEDAIKRRKQLEAEIQAVRARSRVTADEETRSEREAE